MDTPRKDTWRQRLARFRIGKFLDRMDRVIVAGERSFQFARLLKIPESRIIRCVYGFDAAPLEPLLDQRLARPDGWPRRFLYVGRYAPEKGLDTLLRAYAVYRTTTPDPWPLTCCGTGPLRHQLSAAAGVTDRGFVQPTDLPAVFADHGCFVLASHYEPWGVACAEAMYAGLPVICTQAVGASVELVRSFYNGLVVPTDDVPTLAAALRWIHDRYDQLPEIGMRARQFAAPFAAPVWAQRWHAAFFGL